ncbi:MAG: transcriptional repressor [Bacillota bacterium]|nr:transcriptional repressor [Bacillota bacterium]
MQNTDNKEFFTSQGLKNTKSRNLIYEILEQSDVPVTAEQVYLKLKESDFKINLSTVYRILEIFVNKGIALKSNIADSNKSMFELNRMEHKHHIVCIKCKKMFSIEGCPFDEIEKKIQSKLDFDVTGHKLEIFGYCKDCKLIKK